MNVRRSSTEMYFIVCLACFVDSLWAFGQNRDTEFTFLLPAGRTECFYQTTTKNGTLEVEYQVIGGAGLDVDFTIFSPHGVQLASDFRKSDGIHTVEPTEKGDYKLCFDNSFSRVSEKMVFFEVILEEQAGEADGEDDWADMTEPESMLEYKLEDIKDSVDSVHRRLERSRQMQTVLRAFEARDRNLLEDNLWRVSFWSCVSLLVMLGVAVTQVYTVRSLFSDKRRVPT